MKVQFKHPRAIDGKEYTVGVHEIDDTNQNHWFLNALVQSGDCVILDDAKQGSALQGQKTPPQGNKQSSGSSNMFSGVDQPNPSEQSSPKTKSKNLAN